EESRELLVAAEPRPSAGHSVMERVPEGRIGSELEEGLDRLALAGLRSEVERGDALAVARAAEGASLVHVGSELDEPQDRRHTPVRRRPRERRSAILVGVDACAVLDEQPEHIDAVALGGPDEALVDHLLRFVRRLPHREAAVRAVEGALRPCLRRPDELSDHLRQTEPGGDAEVPRLEPEQDRDLSMAPEERRDEWRAAVAAGGEVEPAAGVEHEL